MPMIIPVEELPGDSGILGGLVRLPGGSGERLGVGITSAEGGNEYEGGGDGECCAGGVGGGGRDGDDDGGG